jgi:alpha-galactosidase
MLGMNLPDNDRWTTAILTHPEVLAVNQDEAGHVAHRMTAAAAPAETWMRNLSDGSSAVGIFNRTEQPVSVKVLWSQLGFISAPEVRDVWLRQDLGKQDAFTTELPPHGCVLLKVK